VARCRISTTSPQRRISNPPDMIPEAVVPLRRSPILIR